MKQRIFIAKSLTNSLLIAFILLLFSRVIFFAFNYHSFAQFSITALFQSFFFGILFDSVFLFYTLSPFILFYLLPFRFKSKKGWYLVVKSYFLIILSLGILLNLIDSIYFRFSQKRTGTEIYYMITDKANPLGSYLIDYWYLLIILSLFIYIANRFYPKIEILSLDKFTLRDIPTVFVVIVISILGMRGSLGLKPLRSVDASKYTESGLEALTLNTPFQIISSIESKKPQNPFGPVVFSSDFDSIQSKFYGNRPVVKEKKNIVLIILESFGRNHIGFLTEDESQKISATPFIDSFSKSCLVFPNCYANGRKSIDAVPALFVSLPSLLDQPFIYSWYQANTIRGIQYYLAKEGYNSSFYHGAANGTMGFESFLKKAGPIDYFGLNEFKGDRSKEYDGNWGIYDHFYLHYFNQELEHKKQPYFSTVFTLSSHPPYKIPKDIENKLPNISDPALKSIAYTDYSLKLFFEERTKSPDNNNTIFSSKGQMELFCMVYDPTGQIKPGINNKVVQQLDIMPSILNLSNFQDSFFSLGNSFFDTTTVGRAFFDIYGSYQIVQDEHIFSENALGEKKFYYYPKQYYKLPIPFSENQQLEREMKNELEQLIELFYKRLDQNRFY
jgi:phosphoglycerol transferase MdoB-like AlkP superfamily enzyme